MRQPWKRIRFPEGRTAHLLRLDANGSKTNHLPSILAEVDFDIPRPAPRFDRRRAGIRTKSAL